MVEQGTRRRPVRRDRRVRGPAIAMRMTALPKTTADEQRGASATPIAGTSRKARQMGVSFDLKAGRQTETPRDDHRREMERTGIANRDVDDEGGWASATRAVGREVAPSAAATAKRGRSSSEWANGLSPASFSADRLIIPAPIWESGGFCDVADAAGGGAQDRDLVEAGPSEAAGWRTFHGDSVAAGRYETPILPLRWGEISTTAWRQGSLDNARSRREGAQAEAQAGLEIWARLRARSKK